MDTGAPRRALGEIARAAVFAAVFAALWALAARMRAEALGHGAPDRLALLAAVFALGGALAAFHAKLLADTFRLRRAAARFAAMAMLLAAAAPLATVLVAAFAHRAHFAPTHEALFTETGLYQFGWTFAAGVYIAVLAVPQYVSMWSGAAVLAAAGLHAAGPRLWAWRRSARSRRR